MLNSFTRKKEIFVTNDRKTIKWYCCGPTVYDVSHLGHARCYITFDIIRRILTNYFGYRLFFVMNITDIDDKIIKRARCNHLFDRFLDEFLAELELTADKSQLVRQLHEAAQNYKARRADEQDRDKLIMIETIYKNSLEALSDLETFVASSAPTDANDARRILARLRDVIADEQDSKLAHTVRDHHIFKSLTLKFEQEYFDDMARLDVEPPNALTRVSEFIEETGAYIKRLEQNGYAYRSGGSIYFDTARFDSCDRHLYAKLVREAYGQRKDLEEGEGELSSGQQDGKRSPNDFALWKRSKVGEPSWRTEDFEPGRPGWHIECSVMASKLLGENFDIHAGGHDLRFPHHDNEIAQAEAYYDTGKSWVNYFLHSGHLTISGCKMSKSLKNFITIRQALEDYTSRQLRFAFLAHGWAETLDYSPNTMNTALSYEKTFREFFLNVSDTLRRQSAISCNPIGDQTKLGTGAQICNQFKKWSPQDHQLNEQYLGLVNSVDAALCDNFDTRTTLNHLSSLVKECNKRQNIDSILLKDIACFIKNILSIFGTNFDEIDLAKYLASPTSKDLGDNRSRGSPGAEGGATKYVEALAQFRADIRKISKGDDAQASIKQILQLCDTLRDQTLPQLGVRLEDREIGNVPYVVKLVDSETLARERAQAERKGQERKVKEEAQKLEKLKLQQQRDEKARMSPYEMFKCQTDKYSRFDDKGVPTHDSTGKEISKSALKKLQRVYAEQEARYSRYLESQERK